MDSLTRPSRWTPPPPVLAGSCTVEITEDMFSDDNSSDWCFDYHDIVGSTLFVANAANEASFNRSHVGIYGNSDPLQAREWVPVNIDTTTLSAAFYDVDARTCKSLTTAVNLQFLYSHTGELANPQPIILAAQISYSQADWTWRDTGAAPRTKQKFSFQFTTSFVELEPNTFDYKPDIPPLLPAIPYDVFNPFVISTQAGSKGAKIGSVALGIAAVLSMALVR